MIRQQAADCRREEFGLQRRKAFEEGSEPGLPVLQFLIGARGAGDGKIRPSIELHGGAHAWSDLVA
jgi:hypothetical protein